MLQQMLIRSRGFHQRMTHGLSLSETNLHAIDARLTPLQKLQTRLGWVKTA